MGTEPDRSYFRFESMTGSLLECSRSSMSVVPTQKQCSVYFAETSMVVHEMVPTWYMRALGIQHAKPHGII